jgi:signal transduction histidine kinase/DNA-binding response OmpR family regulator
MALAVVKNKFEHLLWQWRKCVLPLGCYFLSLTASAQNDIPVASRQNLLDRTREISALPSRVFAPPADAPLSGIAPADVPEYLRLAEQLLDNGPPDHCLAMLDQLEPFVPATEQFRFLYLKILALVRREENDRALETCKRLDSLAGDDAGRQGWAAFAEARIRHAQLQFHTTYRLAGRALDFARKSGDKKLEMRALSVIGKVSRDIYMTMPERSAPYHEQALEIARSLQDTAFAIGELVALSLDYLDRPEPEPSLAYLEEAMRWYGPACSLKSRCDLVRQTAFFWHQYSRDAGQSLQLYEATVGLSKLLGMRSQTQNLYEQMSEIYMQRKDYDGAQACLDSAARHSTWKRELGYFYRSFADVALARGDRDSAIKFYQKAFEEQVKGYTNRNTRQLAEWETEFRTRETERQLEEQRARRNQLILLVLFVSLLLLVSGAGWYFQYRNRREIVRQKALIETQAESMRQIDEAKNRLFANISHELRTPLTLILGPLEQVSGSERLSPQQRSMLLTARDNGRRMLDMIRQILDLGKLESGKMALEEKPVMPAALLHDTVAAFADHAEEKGIRLEWHNAIAADTVALMDAPKIETILQNLVSNALKYTGQGGVVRVTAAESDVSLHLEVQDTGRGIAAADLPRVFDRYYQASPEGAAAEGGAGLGLAICMELSKLLGARLGVESDLGKGSTFRLEWPKKTMPGAIFPIAAQTEVFGGLRERKVPGAALNPEAPVVLVVEDNPEMRTFMRSILEPACQVVEARHGEDALEILPRLLQEPAWKQHGGLVLTDLMMPVLDGFGLIRRMRDDARLADVPVIVLSARADAEAGLQTLRIGTDDYLIKPFQSEELLARIRYLLGVQRERLAGALPDATAKSTGPEELQPEIPEREWLDLLEAAVLRHLGEHDFNLDTLSDTMTLSSRTLQRRLKALTGLTTTQYLQELRFREARRLLENGGVVSVKDLALAIGMRDVKYFSREFKKRFGKSPSTYLA